MAYNPKKPPMLVAKGIGGVAGSQIWRMIGTDPIATVIGAGYVSNAYSLGMKAGDTLVYHQSSDLLSSHKLIVLLDGHVATIAFPDISELAVPPIANPADAPGMWLVGTLGGKQVRAALQDVLLAVPDGLAGFASHDHRGVVELATNEEVIAGTDDERAVTPLGLQAAIEARLGVSIQRYSNILRLLALLTLPGNAGKVIAVNSDATGFELVAASTGGGTTPPPSQRADSTIMRADTTTHTSDGVS